MMAPPGTPGAATIVIPNIRIKPAKDVNVTGSPDINKMAMAQATIFIVLPARWIVAQSGITKMAIFCRTPFLIA